MAILKIARMGHPILTSRADPVIDPADPVVQRLIADMVETMQDAGGVGLAAPQVHVGLRLFVYHIPPSRADTPDVPDVPMALLNPELILVDDGPLEPGWEGCLSIPGLRGMVPRAMRVRVRALDAAGTPLAIEATGFHARVLQHEYDHLDGVLYPMRMTDFRYFGFDEELARHAGGSRR